VQLSQAQAQPVPTFRNFGNIPRVRLYQRSLEYPSDLMRQKFLTILRALDCLDHRTVIGIMGWTRIEMLQRYTSLIPSKMREAVMVLDQYRILAGTKTGQNEHAENSEVTQVTEKLGAPGLI
jgi:hypothetical protein